ncbi:uncharacterized protein K452DRAFT_64661 [Aplosporella prunicola CBS 121167]|uniref:Zn(2)-C6 fungal-type domain-containing protein n=1 Tax=Aplosporella prunicola CBS 121167 TaxID=1176127 RepID=A0A6A6B935_9PEZI|nr:uncharacterized protein K452DRAFT_64661 [Aplosporella prunicola CBS 121167]KAF2139724.1 hypothetical protein K452DRAFT_64661 [Aplosporella prunicola CBS 121167]
MSSDDRSNALAADDVPSSPDNASESTTTTSAAAPRPSVPMQKRRRVTRACDECRRKKIKCDGKQPCTHCTVYSYECTYDQPSNRRRNAAPQYVEALENRMKRAEALLAAVLPNLNLDDPSLVAGLEEGQLPPLPQPRPFPPPSFAAGPTEEAQLESMVRATGQLDLDEHGYWDYHGHSSGLSFVRRMRERFDIMGRGEGESTPFSVLSSRPMAHVFESPRSVQDSPGQTDNTPSPGFVELPPKEQALEICEIALNDACALLRVVHLPTFYKNVDEMYNKSFDDYTSKEHSFLPLLYMVLAQGMLFSRSQNVDDESNYENAINEGVQYFKAARSILDIAVCRDLNALQAVVFMILFLQSSAKLSTCYAYIGVALRSALRMGLHRSMDERFNPIENETRKRIFWVVRKMDVYVGAMLGLPHTMSGDEIDQDYPMEIDDEYITETEYGTQPPDQVPLMAACNAHTKLTMLLSKIVRVVYPIKGKTHVLHGQKIKSYTVSYADIRDIEHDLQEWMEELPMELKPGGEQSPLIVKVRQLLRMAYAHTQMMLYRPFIHYVSKSSNCHTLDKRAYACASACVSVSRNIIHIAVEMKRKGMLNGAYWFTMYTTFFAIMTLVFFALENPETQTSKDILKEAHEGKEVLEALAKRSMAADRCTITLKAVFDKLPERIQRGRDMAMAAASRKRRQAPSPNPESKSMSGLSEPDLHDIQPAGPRRANTFPKNSTPEDTKRGGPFRASFPQPVDLTPSPQYGSTPESPFQATVPLRNIYPGVTAGLAPSPVAASSNLFPNPQFGFSPVQNNFADRVSGINPSIPDLNAMMFPSADPLAYPNQPMTTFEKSGFSNINKGDAAPDASNSGANLMTGANFGFGTGTGTPAMTGTSSRNRGGIFALPPNATPHDPHGGSVDVELYNSGPFIFAPHGSFGGLHGGMSAAQQQQQQQQQQQHLHGNAGAGAPMFGLHGAQQRQDMGQGSGGGGGVGGQVSIGMTGGGVTGNMDLDELLTSEEWASMFADQGSGMGMGQGMGFPFR